jgi:DNA/RNA endonuclease G (NUC1)/fibronectin type 3 domain-containing protein
MHKAVRSTLFAVVSFLCLLPGGTLNAQVLRTHPRALDTGTGSVSLTTLGTAATQNFDTLSNTAGSTTNSALPTGWYITETGGGARDNEQYAVDTGGSTTGDIYSYGAAASTDRALGALRSGTLIPLFGAKYTNNTGATISSLVISYNGEEWRLGTAARTDQINFEYSTNATDLSTGTYTGVAALNFVTPDTATTGAKNGNAAADRTALSTTISGLSIPNGASFFIRWTDTDATGADDGLAVDDFSLTANGAANNAPAITPPANPIATVTQDAAPFTVNLTGNDDGAIYNWSATIGTGISNVAVSGGQGTNTVTCTVTLTAGYTGTATFTATLSDNVNTPVNQAVNITVNPPAPPAAPAGLTATPGNAHVQLAWNAVGGATSYNVKRGTAPGGPYTTINSPGTNSYDDTSAVNGSTYYYVVSAIGIGGEGLNSSEVSATPQAAPAAPAGLTATAGDSHVTLSWTASPGAATYTVNRGTAPGGPYGTTFPGLVAPSYDDTSAVNGTTYYYAVTATNGFGTSGNSNEASAMPVSLVAPAGVAAQVGDSTVIINWNAVAGAATYHVNRGTSPGGPYTTVGSPSATTFSDTTAVNGSTYYYVVAGFNGSEGPVSSEVNGTPNTPSVLGVVISQVYGGGGNAGTTLKNDFVELFNRGTQTVSLNGWYVHYSSATATTWNSPVSAGTTPTALSGSIAPGHYYLVQEAAGAAGTTNLPAPDATGTIALSATAAKIALVNAATIAVQCPSGGSVADFVGYGPTANCSETAPTTPALTNTTAALRKNNGCTDTNNNASDFANGAPNPRNSGAPSNNCSIINNPPTITAPADPIASVAQDSSPFAVNLTGSDDGGVYVWSATAGTGISAVTVSNGQNTANVTYSVTLVAGFNGTAAFTATLSDGINPAVNQTVHIQVTVVGGNNPPVITPPVNPITTVAQDPPPFTVNVSGTDDGGIFNWSATPGTGVASVNVTGGQGTATVTYTVALNAGFNGTATFTASLSDNVNPLVNQLVNINVLSAGATPNHVVISQLYGGGGNSGATFTNDFIELYNPTASPVNLAGWSVQYSPATNTGAFTGLQPIGGTIGPGEYFLISLASGGANGSALPAANIVNNSGFNMSGTTGKVALVNTGTPVPGPCTATATDTDIVDLVGYGGANCNEGGTNAPAPSNSTADFRKAGGNTDTNINGNDFVTGTPNPRRTAVISDIAPSVVNTDPTANGVNAPRDASMIVTFTGLVDVSSGWYNINCSSSGVHNDATVVEGAPDTWVITPNINFVAAEQCSVTVFKAFVRSRTNTTPGTETMAADYTWTFTVSTGTMPPYPPDVHLTMGNPSNATFSLSNPNNYLMSKPEMAISYNRDLGRPNWVSWHLTDEWVGSLARVDSFRPDPSVPPDWYRVLASDFFASGFDRGHMCPNADRDKETSIPINQATFLMSNMVAQAPGNNQGPWAALEGYLRTLLPADELYIVSGPAGVGGTGSNGGVTNTVANGHVTVPASTWKCALILPKASGDDIARVTASTRTVCVIMPNLDSIRSDDWHIYLKSVDQVEALSGYDLFSNVPQAIQNAIEAGVDGSNPPGTANQSASTSEDAATAITLDAASPAGTLTYTILTGPFHGTLTGSGANQTYTPAPNFNGTDTFTWRVNDGTNNSNTSTMTITVSEVNDPPVASDDSKSAIANNALTFASSDLTTNDSPGPADEAGQALNVTSVTPTANTHGNVTLTSGQVTYTPATGYAGPASFTYTVCDNGTTAGSLDALCTTATVNVTVNPQVTTHFSVSAPANTTSGTPFNVTVTALDASNVTVTSYTGTVHFTSSSAGSLPSDYTFVAGDSGAHMFSATLTSTGAQSITATDGGITGSANTTVAPPPATHFSVSAPANATTGVPFSVNVTALDASNTIVPSYTGTVHFTSSSAGTLPADYTFAGGDGGAHTFSVTMTSNGAQSITATDGAITGTANTTVAPPPATHFSVNAPANVTSEAAFNLTITALDASNVIVPSYTGTVHFTSSSAGSLPADYTFVAGDNGAHTFSVTLTSIGAQSITATDGAITGSANTTVAPPPATHFSVTAPASVTTSTPFSVSVMALAASGSNATGYNGTVHFTSSSAGTLPADYTFVAGDNGSHTFSVTLDSPGPQTITATDMVTASITGTASTTVICPPAPAPTANASNSGPACAGTTVNLFASGNGSIFSWTGPGGFTSPQQNPTGITTGGTYTVTVSTPGPCGGSAQASTTVVFNPIPSPAIATSATVCATSTGNTASVPNAGAGATYAWAITNGTVTGGAGTASITYTSGSASAIQLAVTVTTASGCSASSTADVAIAPRPTITLPATINASCGTSTVNIPFTLTGTGPWTLLWSDGVTQSGITSASSSRNVSVSTSLMISAVVSDASCSNGSAMVSINVATAPVITTQPVSQNVEPSQTGMFTVVASGANLHYQWFVKHGNGATLAVGTDTPSFTTTPEGNSAWFVTVSNECGSVTSDSVTAHTIPPRRRATSF